MTSNKIACTDCGATNRVPVVTGGKPRCAKCQAFLPWLTDADSGELDQIIQESTIPVLVDLWAPWCGPCRMIAPALVDLSKDRAGSLRVVKVNVDHHPEVSARLAVQGIPTMILFDGGSEVGRQIGALPADRIQAWVDSSLGQAAGR